MADTHAKHHDYHLVNPSPWPVVGSVSALVLAIGAVQYFHAETPVGHDYWAGWGFIYHAGVVA